MYKINRTGNKVPKVLKNVFPTYDEARKAIRKWLYSYFKRYPGVRTIVDCTNRTATIGQYGFSIKYVC